MSESGSNLILTRGLSKRYGRHLALDEISIEVPGEGITALMGPNGAGKSTFLRLCVGFERPSAGELSIGGFDPVRQRREALSLTAYVSQAPSLYRDLSARDHIELARVLRPGFDVGYVRARLATLSIDPKAKPTQMSGGQQAQLSLALALGTRAPLVLLDEPLANLDPLARRYFLAIVAEAVQAGDTSVLLSSHVISEVDEVADRLLVLGDGRVVFYDTVSASITRHRVIEGLAEAEGSVATYPGAHGQLHTLVRSTDFALGRSPTLEEVVLGYLARPNRIHARPSGAAWDD